MSSKFTIRTTIGLSLGAPINFSTYEDASDYADLLTEDQPYGELILTDTNGKVFMSYTRTLPKKTK